MRVVPQPEVERYRRISADFELEKLQIEEKIARRNAGLVDKMMAWEKGLTAAEKSRLPGNVQDILKVPTEKRELAQAEDLEKFYNENDTAYQDLLHRKEILVATPNRGNPNYYSAMVLAEREQPRKSWVLIRGDFLKHGVEVTPATLAVLPPMEAPHSYPNRMDLAKWLVSTKNPLTPRVIVNRMWQHYFGRGLVKTSEDFGTQGEPPSHPELMDWLATEFIRQGWHMKAMHRLIVTSAMYRQSANVTPEMKERDPEDILMERAPRYRVDAEVVRDIALSTSGLLESAGGRSERFPAPACRHYRPEPRQPPLDRRHRQRSLSPRHVHLLETYVALSLAAGV